MTTTAKHFRLPIGWLVLAAIAFVLFMAYLEEQNALSETRRENARLGQQYGYSDDCDGGCRGRPLR